MQTFKVIYWKNNFLTIDLVKAASVEAVCEQYPSWMSFDSITKVGA